MTEEGDFDGFANLDALALLHEDLARVFATIFTVERGDAVLLWVVAFFEGLQGGHEVVAAGDAVGDDALGDTSGDGTLDNGGDRVHGPDDFGLELWGHMKLDLLEEVFGGTKTTNHQDVLVMLEHKLGAHNIGLLPVEPCSVLEWR